MATGTIWICKSSHTNCTLHILQEVGAERKVSNQHLSTLGLKDQPLCCSTGNRKTVTNGKGAMNVHMDVSYLINHSTGSQKEVKDAHGVQDWQTD